MSTTPEYTPLRKPNELTGRGVLFYMLAFFAVIFAVNGVFLYTAITTHPGEHTEKSYLQGLAYNDTLAARRAQADLGWSAAMGLEHDTSGDLIVLLASADGAVLAGQTVTADARKRSSKHEDAVFGLLETSPGEYRSTVDLDTGVWDILVQVGSADAVVFEARKTVTVK